MVPDPPFLTFISLLSHFVGGTGSSPVASPARVARAAQGCPRAWPDLAQLCAQRSAWPGHAAFCLWEARTPGTIPWRRCRAPPSPAGAFDTCSTLWFRLLQVQLPANMPGDMPALGGGPCHGLQLWGPGTTRALMHSLRALAPPRGKGQGSRVAAVPGGRWRGAAGCLEGHRPGCPAACRLLRAELGWEAGAGRHHGFARPRAPTAPSSSCSAPPGPPWSSLDVWGGAWWPGS